VFHEKLGTVADKVERVAKLAEWLASLEGTGLLRADPEQTKQAARLCKADLVTEMVGEFPELQGLMGGYYAEKEGLPVEVSHAIRDHYKPVGQGDDVPIDPVTVWVSLADKLDTLAGFFVIQERPTGSKDPYALRRAVLSIISQITVNQIRLPLRHALAHSLALILGRLIGTRDRALFQERMKLLDEIGVSISEEIQKSLYEKSLEDAQAQATPMFEAVISPTLDEILDFFADRLKVQQREAGVRHDLIDAVFALGGEDDLVRLLARVKALQAFVETADGVNLLAGYKRASNILKKEAPEGASSTRHPELVSGSPEVLKQVQDDESDSDAAKSLSYTPEKAEKALIDALDAAQPEVIAAIEAEQFETAMTALAALRGPIDQFFEDVTVNDDDEAKREARLALLARFRNAVHQVADFSQIEG